MEKISDNAVLASVFAKKIKKVSSKDQNDNPQQSKMAGKVPKQRAYGSWNYNIVYLDL